MGEGAADMECGIGRMVVGRGGRDIQPDNQPADQQDEQKKPRGSAFPTSMSRS
jgi:hypothetical protein